MCNYVSVSAVKSLTPTADLSLRVAEFDLAGKKWNSYYSVELEILNTAKSPVSEGIY